MTKFCCFLVSILLVQQAFAQVEKSPFSHDSILYSQLKTRFDESQTPYPIESIVATSRQSTSVFSGCTLAYKIEADTVGIADYPPFVFFRYKITRVPAHGPLDPGQVVYSIRLIFAKDFGVLFQGGASMENGIVNMDGATFSSNRVKPCIDGTSQKETWYNSVISHTPTDYRMTESCNDGRLRNDLIFRQSAGYLIFHSPLYDNYGYCWK